MKIFTNLISKRIKNVIGKGSSILLLLLCCVVASAQQVEVTLTVAGTLSEKIATDQKYTITSLKVSGPINGTDVGYLREMAGWDYNGDRTSGKLVELDLTDANIVEGGDGYYYYDYGDGYYHWQYQYTENNVLGYYIFTNCNLTSIKLPNSVTSIGNGAFSNCSSLSSVTIPNSVTSIGSYAFYDCSSLSSVTIPNSVTNIGSFAFCDCSSLSSVTIGNSVTSIGSYAFKGCSGLYSITVPSSVISIGSSAFSYNLKKVIMLPNSAPSGLSSVFAGSN